MKMELRVLKYFLVIAREENFTKAAKQLHITQPTLSRQIAQLEDELGVTLFERNNHKIVLSENGMILKRRAQEIISLANKTQQNFLYKDEHLEGTISIGCGEFQATKCLADCIASFRKEHPHIKYELYSGNTNNIKDNIERGFIDLGLMSCPIDLSKFESVEMPLKETWGVLVKKDSQLALKEFIEPQDLIDLPIVTSIGDYQETILNHWFGKYQDQMNIVARGNLIYNEALFVQSNVGVVLGIKLNYDYKDLCFIPLKPSLHQQTALAWKKEQFFSPATTAFIKYAKEYFKR